MPSSKRGEGERRVRLRSRPYPAPQPVRVRYVDPATLRPQAPGPADKDSPMETP
jgi:hypothetical protein